jgi:hypothetical protein
MATAIAAVRIRAKGDMKASVNRIGFSSSGGDVCVVFKAHGSHPDDGMNRTSGPCYSHAGFLFLTDETGLITKETGLFDF